MSRKTCIIHQPNFFPWMPFFEKIKRADVVVLLDDAQFPKKGGTWMNRVKLRNLKGPSMYMTAPVDRAYSGVRNINEMRFAPVDWRQSIKDKLHWCYKDAVKYKAWRPHIENIIDFRSDKISIFNLQAIAFLSSIMKIKFSDRVKLSSQLNIKSTGTDRLVDITQKVGCDTYLTGVGASDYLDIDKFIKAELLLECLPMEVYEDQEYSVLDYIFNGGL